MPRDPELDGEAAPMVKAAAAADEMAPGERAVVPLVEVLVLVRELPRRNLQSRYGIQHVRRMHRLPTTFLCPHQRLRGLRGLSCWTLGDWWRE